MNLLPTLGVPFGGGGSSGGVPLVLLSEGVYWYDGDALVDGKTPHEGQGWTLTTALSNGVSGDTTTRVTATGANISVCHVAGAAFTIATWDLTLKWLGDVLIVYREWDGSEWDALVPFSANPPTHETYLDEQILTLLGSATSKTIHMFRAVVSDTTGSSFASCSDSRPSA